MIAHDTRVVGVDPRITRQRFVDVLTGLKSPAAEHAGEAWDAVVAERVDPLLALGIFWCESQCATDRASVTLRYALNNPGATRSSTTGVGETVATDKGEFQRYPNWVEGFRDLAHRLVSAQKPYIGNPADPLDDADTPGEIVPIWAPSSDGNDPNGYLQRLLAAMGRWYEALPPPPSPVSGGIVPTLGRALHVALSSGHHNTSGGNARETLLTGELTEAIARTLTAGGVEVRVVTPDGPDPDSEPGDGMYPGGLQDVAQKVTDWHQSGWPVDLFLEVHFQGLGNTGVRGQFGIYPDWGDDVDVDARDRLIPAMARQMARQTGIPVWSTGVMSEKRTGVGLEGYRLGVFLRTAAIREHATRIVYEFGTHTNPSDLALIQRPEFNDSAARAVLSALAEVYQFTPATATQPEPSIVFFPETGRYVGGGFLAFWRAYGGLPIFGYPLTDEFPEVNRDTGQTYTVQYFERARFEWHPLDGGDPADWHVMLGRVGSERLLQTPARFYPKGTSDPRDPAVRYFPETGIGIHGAIRLFWEHYGGLKVFGLPLTEEFTDMEGRQVQYFERARFEWKPGTGTPFDVQLGRIGAELLEHPPANG